MFDKLQNLLELIRCDQEIYQSIKNIIIREPILFIEFINGNKYEVHENGLVMHVDFCGYYFNIESIPSIFYNNLIEDVNILKLNEHKFLLEDFFIYRIKIEKNLFEIIHKKNDYLDQYIEIKHDKNYSFKYDGKIYNGETVEDIIKKYNIIARNQKLKQQIYEQFDTDKFYIDENWEQFRISHKNNVIKLNKFVNNNKRIVGELNEIIFNIVELEEFWKIYQNYINKNCLEEFFEEYEFRNDHIHIDYDDEYIKCIKVTIDLDFKYTLHVYNQNKKYLSHVDKIEIPEKINNFSKTWMLTIQIKNIFDYVHSKLPKIKNINEDNSIIIVKNKEDLNKIKEMISNKLW